jgi:hypothetical protein
MFKHKKVAKAKLSKDKFCTIKVKDFQPIAESMKTQFNLEDVFKPIE